MKKRSLKWIFYFFIPLTLAGISFQYYPKGYLGMGLSIFFIFTSLVAIYYLRKKYSKKGPLNNKQISLFLFIIGLLLISGTIRRYDLLAGQILGIIFLIVSIYFFIKRKEKPLQINLP